MRAVELHEHALYDFNRFFIAGNSDCLFVGAESIKQDFKDFIKLPCIIRMPLFENLYFQLLFKIFSCTISFFHQIASHRILLSQALDKG